MTEIRYTLQAENGRTLGTSSRYLPVFRKCVELAVGLPPLPQMVQGGFLEGLLGDAPRQAQGARPLQRRP